MHLTRLNIFQTCCLNKLDNKIGTLQKKTLPLTKVGVGKSGGKRRNNIVKSRIG